MPLFGKAFTQGAERIFGRMGSTVKQEAKRDASRVFHVDPSGTVFPPGMSREMVGSTRETFHAGPTLRAPPRSVSAVTGVGMGGKTYVNAVNEPWKFRGSGLDRMAGSAVRGSKFVLGATAVTGVAGLTGYGAFSMGQSQVSAHRATAKALNGMSKSLKYGGTTRPGDFEYNPMATFSRPRVRSGHLGASGNLTLSLNNMRTR